MPALQKTIFEQVLQLPPEVVQARFGYMLESFRFVRLSSSRDNKGAGAIVALVLGSGAAFLVFGALGA
ncbi:MAG: hypothetical protein HC806_04000 [Anaerolineae bacterium]|nr:hypothetical protein [Anaerolineae bacterium]